MRPFLNFIKDKNLGVSLYEMKTVPGQLETWEKLTLSSDGNTVEKTPCN